jgi:hypothetical protein
MAHTHLPYLRGAARALLTLTLLLPAAAAAAGAQAPTAFTYQGRLTDAGAPASGAYDFEFRLFDGSGAQLGTAQAREDVAVTNGVFLVRLDFGVSPFVPGAAASTLEIGVRPGASTGAFTTLAPRQPISATPYAVQTINAEMLGGVPADQYVRTDDPRLTDGGPPAPGSNNYVQNTTTQQAGVSFNIGGNGLFGGQVGVGTQAPRAGVRLHVAGGNFLVESGNGRETQMGSPNGETGMSLHTPTRRADVRFDGTSLKLVAGNAGGPPPNTSGLSVGVSGNVGVGIEAALTGKLHVVGGAGQPALFAQSDNRGVWGFSTGSSYGVYGESTSGIGVQGVGNANVGVSGLSTSNSGVFGSSTGGAGVYGQTAAANGASSGVFGTSTGAGGIGVAGHANQANGTGVYGASTADGGKGVMGRTSTNNSVGVYGDATAGGTGLYGRSVSGRAVYADGNAGQARDKGGFVKAMIYINPFLPADQYVVRCYNGMTNTNTGNCGFSVTRTGVGTYEVDFMFPVGDRFYSLSLESSLVSGGIRASSQTALFVSSFNHGEDKFEDEKFFIIVF